MRSVGLPTELIGPSALVTTGTPFVARATGVICLTDGFRIVHELVHVTRARARGESWA